MNLAHKDLEKRKLRAVPSDHNIEKFEMACPICGDSTKSNKKKRGCLRLSTLMYSCLNCGAKMGFIKFCDTLKNPVDLEEKMKLYEHIDNNVSFYKNNDEYAIQNLDKLIKIDDFINFYKFNPNAFLTGVSKIDHESAIYNYLKHERLIDDHTDFLQGVYQAIKDGEVVYKTPVVILMNRCGEYLAGVQLRNLKKGEGRFFKIVEFNKIYDEMHSQNPLDEIEMGQYNKLSHFFNILNIDFTKPVTVFEGFIDSKFAPNSIGLVGANNDDDVLKFLLNNEEGLDIRFFFDNDYFGTDKNGKMFNKGFHMSEKKLHQGYTIFLWNKLFLDIMKNKRDRYAAANRLKHIKDLNQLAIDSRNPKVYYNMNLEKYYSIDDFDKRFLVDIDKLI